MIMSHDLIRISVGREVDWSIETKGVTATQTQEDLESTKQRIEQDQQKKLQHRQEIDQGIVRPMPDNLQQRIHLFGNTKG